MKGSCCAEFSLSDAVFIGSASSNTIRLEESSASAHHCRIVRENGRFILTDMDSTGGTFVNGMPAKERELQSGDQISVGESVFVFKTDVSRAISNPLQLDEVPEEKVPLRQFQKDELVNLHPESLAALPQSERLSRNLSALLRISTAIGSIRDVESLQWALLGMIFDVIPAERGAVVLVKDSTLEIQSHIAWDRVAGPDQPVHVSQAMIRKVVEERVFLLDTMPVGAESSSTPEPSLPSGVVSTLCVPLVAARSPIGII